MIYQTTDPTKMLETLASLIIKGPGGLSDALVFVPTRRAARGLEKILCAQSGGQTLLPKIVPLGEGDDSEETVDVIGNTERGIMLAKLLMSVHGKIGVKGNFAGALSTANELLVMADYLENEGVDIRDIDWQSLVPDERKAKFLNAVKDVDFGMTATKARNQKISNWKNHLGEYGAVFCAGSTASVKSTRDLMAAIADLKNGFVIFPGMVEDSADIGRTDPYWSVKKFLKETGREIETIDVGPADKIQFFNRCFSNDVSGGKLKSPEHIRQIDCDTESEEANVAAAIVAMVRHGGKSVMIITPDSAGEQRIRAALDEYGLSYDSSAGTPLAMTPIGRWTMRLFDYIGGTDNKNIVAADLSQSRSALDELKYNGNLLEFIVVAMEKLGYKIDDAAAADLFFEKVGELSNIVEKYDLDANDAGIVLAEMLGAESVRAPMSAEYDVRILGAAESRMQTADVVIITGLGDGMFPAKGFEHGWLPRNIAHKIGIPSSDSKVSLMALDFMTLSCGREVYWTRSKMAAGCETIPSRFLSRAAVMAEVPKCADILAAVRTRDDVPLCPLDRALPVVEYKGDYHATWLESLIHNPYLFYARHILNLRRRPDPGDEVGAREFGTLVHDVIEKCGKSGIADERKIVALLEAGAPDRESVLFRFWQNRFREMAPEIAKTSARPAKIEETIRMRMNGRDLIARADRIEGDKVIDYKTGGIPTNAQLGLGKDADCAMPQLPIEAMILKEIRPGANVSMAFLSLKKNDIGMKEFSTDETARSIETAKKMLAWALKIDTFARPGHYIEEKYRDFDDLCRAGD